MGASTDNKVHNSEMTAGSGVVVAVVVVVADLFFRLVFCCLLFFFLFLPFFLDGMVVSFFSVIRRAGKDRSRTGASSRQTERIGDRILCVSIVVVKFSENDTRLRTVIQLIIKNQRVSRLDAIQ